MQIEGRMLTVHAVSDRGPPKNIEMYMLICICTCMYIVQKLMQ